MSNNTRINIKENLKNIIKKIPKDVQHIPELSNSKKKINKYLKCLPDTLNHNENVLLLQLTKAIIDQMVESN